MAVVDTGWVLVDSGDTTNVVVPAGTIVSARVRWKGQTITDTDSDYNEETGEDLNSKSGSVAVPSKPSGWSWDRVRAYTAVSLSSSSSWSVAATADGEEQSNSGSGTSGSVTSTAYGTPSIMYTSHNANAPVSYNYTFRATGYWTRDYNSTNPQISVGGQVTNLVDVLNDDEVSDWKAASGFVAGTTNVVTHTVTGSGDVYVQIEVTYGALGHSGSVGSPLIFS